MSPKFDRKSKPQALQGENSESPDSVFWPPSRPLTARSSVSNLNYDLGDCGHNDNFKFNVAWLVVASGIGFLIGWVVSYSLFIIFSRSCDVLEPTPSSTQMCNFTDQTLLLKTTKSSHEIHYEPKGLTDSPYFLLSVTSCTADNREREAFESMVHVTDWQSKLSEKSLAYFTVNNGKMEHWKLGKAELLKNVSPGSAIYLFSHPSPKRDCCVLRAYDYHL